MYIHMWEQREGIFLSYELCTVSGMEVEIIAKCNNMVEVSWVTSKALRTHIDDKCTWTGTEIHGFPDPG